METVAIANIFVFVVVSGIAIYFGLELKKWSSWLFSLYGFLSGFLIGFIKGGVQGGLEFGALCAFVVMFGGVMSYWHRQRFGKRE